MLKRGIATFSLDYGKCPKWLFERMVKLGREIVWLMIAEFGSDEFVKRMADPAWFQSLGTVLAFDWNASGLTTIMTAALKEAIRGAERNLGIVICGGKGKTSRKTPEEIQIWCDRMSFENNKSNNLIYSSKMAAKVDSSLVQDGYQLYHHSFIFSQSGVWAVIQQGMNVTNATARRYHWYGEGKKNFVLEPHSAICAQTKALYTLNLTANKSIDTQKVSLQLLSRGFNSLEKELKLLHAKMTDQSKVFTVGTKDREYSLMTLSNIEFRYLPVASEDFSKNKYLRKIFYDLSEKKPSDYESFLSAKGVGQKTVRALALVAEIIYGARPSYEDPARYSFAHGGKDSIPYPVDKSVYDNTIETMKKIVNSVKINFSEKKKIMARLDAKRKITPNKPITAI